MYPNKCLHELFSESCRKTPDKVAVVDYEGRSMTFAELDGRTTLLACYLRSKGCTTNSVVGIYMERCMEYVVAYIAALKAGGCYLPIEYSYPVPLLNSVIEDANPVTVLTLSRYKEWLPSTVNVFCLDEGWQQAAEKVVTTDLTNVSYSLDDLAYVIYSSGTTGAPKGIMCKHRGAVMSYTWRHVNYPYSEQDRVACNVFFVWEMLRPLLKNITLYVIPDDVIYDPLKLLNFLKDSKITQILLTPSLLEAILSENNLDFRDFLQHMRHVWLCGEVVTTTLRNRFVELFPGVKLLNLYSISEAHDIANSDLSHGMLEKWNNGQAYTRKFCPVGKVLDGVHVVTLDENLNQLPIGMSGEIYIGGPTLAVGYLNREELTKEKFIQTPEGLRNNEIGEKLYKTGDWGYMLSSGDLEICGRCDSMVKIRGFSIELQAIEAALLDIGLIKACKVQAQGEEGEDKYLVAYVVPSEKVSKREIRAALKAKLPAYMIPSHFVMLSSVPIASSGKLDSRMLPTFDAQQETAEVNGKPTTETETVVHQFWKTVLNLTQVDTQDNFFDLGGHSLLAAALINQVRQKYNIKFDMPDLFNNNTVVEMAAFIDSQLGNNPLKRTGSIDIDVDLVNEVQYHDQSFINMDMMLRAFWRSCQYEHKWMKGRVFLTGATGFLGAHLLKDLLLHTKLHVYCLVRERTGERSEARLLDNMVYYDLLPSGSEDPAADCEKTALSKKYQQRVTVLNGDVSLQNFGLKNEDYTYLTYEIDFIIHSAAVVNLIYPYKTLHGTNVVGTQNIVMFAGCSKIKPIHYISTDAVFSQSTVDCREDSDLSDEHNNLTYGYAQSKWVGEQLVLKAAKGGLPAAVYRLGNLSGDSVSGRWNPRDFNLMFMLTCVNAKCAPLVDLDMEMTPVDFVSRAIVALTQQISWSMGKVYHFINTKPISTRHFFDWISLQGYPVSILPYTEWKSRVEEYREKTGESTYISKTLDILHSLYHSKFEDKRVFDNTNLLKFLKLHLKKKYHYANSPLFKTYLEKMAERGEIGKPELSNGVLRPLSGRVAIVTGASSGIGEAISKKLALKGATVVMAARRIDKLEEIRNKLVASGCSVSAVKTDVTKRDEVLELVEDVCEMFSSVDIMINCAGVMCYGYLKNLAYQEWEKQIDVNCKGVMYGCGAVLPKMIKQQSGHIINISSDAGKKVFPGLSVYSATKAFVEFFSQGLRLETADTGIKVTTIQPGDVRTNLLEQTTDQQAKEELAQNDPEKFLEAEDIADAVLYSLTQPPNCAVNEILVEPRQAPT